MEPDFQQTIDKESLSQLPLGRFEGSIVTVDRPELVEAACRDLSSHPAIGFDTETRPAFQAGVVYNTALLQLSTPDTCYLFRLTKIPLERPILKILESRKIAKIGVAVRDDLKSLQNLRKFRPGGFVELQGLAAEHGITDKSVRKIAGIVLGVRISKAQRLTNWSAESLTPAQELYAATDAWVVLEIFRKLKQIEKSYK